MTEFPNAGYPNPDQPTRASTAPEAPPQPDQDAPEQDASSGQDASPEQDAPEQDDEQREVALSEPGKVMRIGTMAKQLLDEVRNMELDEAARARLAEIHRRTVDELSDGMSGELVDELKRLDLPLENAEAPTTAELRLAQAQLVGWLEGLFHGIQTAIMAQQALAQQGPGRPQGQLPPGMRIAQQDGGAGRGPQSGRDDGHSGTGNYL